MVNFLKCRMFSAFLMSVNTMQPKADQSFLRTIDEYQEFITIVIDDPRFPADVSADEQKYTLSKVIEVIDVLCDEVPAPPPPKDALLFTVLLPTSTTIHRFVHRKSSVALLIFPSARHIDMTQPFLFHAELVATLPTEFRNAAFAALFHAVRTPRWASSTTRQRT